MTDEMLKMVNVIKENDFDLLGKNTYIERHIAPDIPEKINKKLLRYWSSTLPINGVVAVYDTGVFGGGKKGLIFTTDGIYYSGHRENGYINYADIETIEKEYNVLWINKDDAGHSRIQPICSSEFNLDVLERILRKLKAIDAEYGQSSTIVSGKVEKVKLTKDEKAQCKKVIHAAATACAAIAAASAQVPGSDSIGMAPIQVGMIIKVGLVFDVSLTKGLAAGIFATLGTGVVGRTISQFLVGWVPVAGNAFNAATAFALTETIGWGATDLLKGVSITGNFEGLKAGYAEASNEYEKKLNEQAEEFFKEAKDIEKERDEYEKLLDDYEKYIVELKRNNASEDELVRVKCTYFGLQGLKDAEEID